MEDHNIDEKPKLQYFLVKGYPTSSLRDPAIYGVGQIKSLGIFPTKHSIYS